MNKKLKKKLIINGFEKMIKELERIDPKDSDKVALGVQMVFEHFDCSPNGGVIFDIIDYLNMKSEKNSHEFQDRDF